MRHQLESLYEQELYAVRRLAAEFARDRPKIAGRLDLSGETGISEDPHVERLIESFAFLTARIRLKLEDEFPELTDALLSVLYPHYLAPIPSMSIVQFQLDPEQGQLAAGYTIPRHSRLYTREVQGMPCCFRTAYPATLWPIEIRSARYQVAPFGEGIILPQGLRDTEALLRLELRAVGGIKFGQMELDTLRFFLSGDDRTVYQLYELLLNGAKRIVVRAAGGPKDAAVVLGAERLKSVGFERDEGLLPYGSQSFLGYRLLTEYFAFPAKFLFVDLTGLSAARRETAGQTLEVLILFDTADRTLEARVNEQTFRLGCAPAVNLFEQSADPIRLTHTKTEYRVIPDVRHARGMEVYSVDRVETTELGTGRRVPYEPFFAFRHGSRPGQQNLYWHTRRAPSLRTGDAGTDVYLALVDLEFHPALPQAEELFVSTTCTNRDLPGELRHVQGEQWGFQLEGKAPLRAIQPVVFPTPALRLPAGEHRWRLISHLALNHLSITDEQSGADALREILRLYDFANSRVTMQQISGVTRVFSRRKTLRISDGMRGGFCRGVEVSVELDAERFTGSGLYLFAAVLDRFLGLYASLNSFTRMITRVKGEAEPYKEWPHRIGERTLM